MKKFFFFILVLLFLVIAENTYARQLFINSDTGELSTERPQNIGLWPNKESSDPYCQEFIDAQYINHDGRYQIDEWIYIEQNYQTYGSIISVVSVYDLKELINYAFNEGIWHEPDNCYSIWQLIKSQIIENAVKSISSQSRPTLTSRYHGLLVDIRCKFNQNSEDLPCTSQMLRQITHASTGMPFRSYSRK